MSLSPVRRVDGAIPNFVPGVSHGPVKSICRNAWGGLAQGVTKVDSTNRPNGLMRVPALNIQAMEAALGMLLARHPVLNCYIEDREGDPWLIPCGVAPSVAFLDFAHGVTDADRDEAEAAVGALVWAPFEVGKGPLYRAYAVRFGQAEYYLGLVSHHFVSDAISLQVLMGDFVHLYLATLTGRQPALPAAGLTYQDYLHGLTEWIQSDVGRQTRRSALDRLLSVSPLNFGDRIESDDGEEEIFAIDPAVVDRARLASREMGVSLFTVLLAAQNLLLRRYSSDDTVPIKVITAGREASALLTTVGNMADRIYVTTRVAGAADGLEFVRRTQEAIATSRKQAFVRNDFLQADLSDRGREVLAPVFNFINAPPRTGRAQGSAPTMRRRSIQVPPPPGEVRTRPKDTYYLVITDTGETVFGKIRYGGGRLRDFPADFEDCLANVTSAEATMGA